jgi:hypothetical protein
VFTGSTDQNESDHMAGLGQILVHRSDYVDFVHLSLTSVSRRTAARLARQPPRSSSRSSC